MKKYRMYISVMAAAAIIVLGSCQKETMNSELSASKPAGSAPGLKAGNATPVASASGQGTLTTEYMEGIPQHFAFHAIKAVGGSVSGSVETHSPGQDIFLHAKVVCLVVTGNEAVITAQVTRVNEGNPFGSVVGEFIRFHVKDNGEGTNAPPDQFTDYFEVRRHIDCEELPVEVGYSDIEAGNIQVRN